MGNFNALVVAADLFFFFLKNYLLKKNLSGKLSVSNGLDPDQDRRSVGPYLYTDCLKTAEELMTHAYVKT